MAHQGRPTLALLLGFIPVDCLHRDASYYSSHVTSGVVEAELGPGLVVKGTKFDHAPHAARYALR
jgi:hypothetical protein